ncbi:LOW QUALITY PROTEIN: hypothetical protein MBEHAL_0568 [Halarchaeum acidiphilum MH1-52-1]|uniref:Acyltransferase n=1 Tax=Halarchaeum acidiphilum MH1-52-1 TaxID=1261545 RepID=U3AAQ2_9EURY|nr:LOW QUALITY PROTEIN: hypothetical protein MBEHAL_0568 [Halarchaeum acidiphilum MH1-52-1]
MFGSDPLDRLRLPDGTTVEEHDLVNDGDVLVGGQSTVEFGVRGQNVVAGERARFGGDIEAEADVRLDMWSDVDGNVLASGDAYLGERAHIAGRLVVGGDLDIGDDVDIEEGFEANGWIVIRNPMPTVVFFMTYLAQLLRLGEEAEAQELIDELSAETDAPPITIPRGAHVSDDAWRASAPAEIGDACRLHGNVRATEIEVGADSNLFGSCARRPTSSSASARRSHGDVTTRGGDVYVREGALILGDVSGENVVVHPDADIDGGIRARGEMTLDREPRRDPE